MKTVTLGAKSVSELGMKLAELLSPYDSDALVSLHIGQDSTYVLDKYFYAVVVLKGDLEECKRS